MIDYRGYIVREGKEIEVTADLYDDGHGYSDYWPDTGHTFEIEKDPEFYKFYAEDDEGNSLSLTKEEIEFVTKQMIEYYWEHN